MINHENMVSITAGDPHSHLTFFWVSFRRMVVSDEILCINLDKNS